MAVVVVAAQEAAVSKQLHVQLADMDGYQRQEVAYAYAGREPQTARVVSSCATVVPCSEHLRVSPHINLRVSLMVERRGLRRGVEHPERETAASYLYLYSQAGYLSDCLKVHWRF